MANVSTSRAGASSAVGSRATAKKPIPLRARRSATEEPKLKTVFPLASRTLDLARKRAAKLARLAQPKRTTFISRMIDSGELLESGPFADHMGFTRQALSKALAANRVFFVEDLGVRYYPSFYFSSRQDRRHLERVSKVLGDLPGGAKLQFFQAAKGSLGGKSPLDALADGKLSAVLAAAEGFVKG